MSLALALAVAAAAEVTPSVVIKDSELTASSAFVAEAISNEMDGHFEMSQSDELAVEHSATITVEFPEQIEDWDYHLETEFRDLVTAKATATLDGPGERRLEELRRARRAFKNPRTAEEIASEARHQRLTNELLKAFDNYVQYRQASAAQSAEEALCES